MDVRYRRSTSKPRLHVSVNLLLEYGRHVARLHRRRRRRRRRRRAYAPTSNTASRGTHEKINSWVPFSSLIWVWGSALRPSAAGAPLLKNDVYRLQIPALVPEINLVPRAFSLAWISVPGLALADRASVKNSKWPPQNTREKGRQSF